MKRLTLFFVLLVSLALVPLRPVSAQSGACPPGSVSVGSISGTVPDNTDLCVTSLNRAWVDNDTNYPCDQQIVVDWRELLSPTRNDPIFIVPDPNTYYGSQIRVRLLISEQDPTLFPRDNFYNIDVFIGYFDSNNLLQDYVWNSLDNYTVVYTYYSSTFNYYYPVYVIDQVLRTNEPNSGYIGIRLGHNAQNADFDFRGVVDVKYSSIQIGAYNDTFPPHCPLPNGDLPSTPMPGPTPTGTIPATWTPNPTGTATPTPISTPAATATGIASQPTWTPTPITFATIQPELTPTPWQQYIIPTVRWPTPYPTIYASSASAQATAEAADPTRQWMVDTLLSSADDINDAWGTPRAQARIWTDPEQTGYISTTTQTGEQITDYISLPIGYVKGVQALMPNAWLFIAWIMSLVSLIVFPTIAKYFLAVLKALIYIIKLVWGFLVDIWNGIAELIPG